MKTKTIEPVRVVKGQSLNKTFEVQRVELIPLIMGMNNTIVDDMVQITSRTGPYQRNGVARLIEFRKAHPNQKYRLVHVIKEWDEE